MLIFIDLKRRGAWCVPRQLPQLRSSTTTGASGKAAKCNDSAALCPKRTLGSCWRVGRRRVVATPAQFATGPARDIQIGE